MSFAPAGRTTLFGSLLILALGTGLAAQAPDAGRALTPDDYDRWRTIESTALSPDGEWLTFAYGHRVIDDTLQVRSLSDATVHSVPRAVSPRFSDDSRWLAYRIAHPRDEAKKLEREGEEVPTEVGLLDLETGERWSWPGGDRFAFSEGASALGVHKKPTGGAEKDEDAPRGTDLIVRDLTRGVDLVLGNVESFGFNDSGTILAYTVDADDQAGNGLYILRLDSGVLTALDQSPLRYAQLTWDESGTALAALKGSRDSALAERTNALVAVRGLDGGEARTFVLNADELDGFPGGVVLSERGSLRWAADGSKVFAGIKPQRAALVDDPEHPRPNVDVFHWKDDRIQSLQRNRANADRDFTFLSTIDLDTGRLVALADSAMASVQLTEDGAWGVGRDASPYLSDWKEPRADYYRIDTSSGARTPIAEEQGRTLGLSPDGTHYAYWRAGHVWAYALATGELTNLTESAPVSFVSEQFDRPGTKPPYGVAGWTADGRGIVLSHRYDLWLQPLDGSAATNLTGGRGARDEIQFRYLRLDPDEDAIDLTRPILLRAYGEWTKKSGYFRLAGGELTELAFGDREYGRLLKAADADRYVFTSSTFAEFPDLYLSDGRFRDPERVTDANPQQAEYRWGHRILFDYENSDGVRLQGTLAIPDSYEPGQRLPMIVNFYEKKSQELHSYYMPRWEGGYPSGNMGPVAEFAAYVSNGYLVMQADVHFNTGTTHSDMLDCVVAATEKVIEMGYADPDRIALGGGSFSGGGSAFIATRTDMFAAIVARAAPINLAGEFNINFPGSGNNNHRYDIYGQGRYGTNPFDDFELYRRQSPITHVENMDTPLLYLHGVQDGSVEYLQGMEFYNALRFLGKPIIFLSYPDEGHNLRKYENQRDFVDRLWQFLDHYLKDAPAPKWMTDGVRFLDRGH